MKIFQQWYLPLFLIFIAFSFFTSAAAQTHTIEKLDSAARQLPKMKDDTVKAKATIKLSESYLSINQFEKAMSYGLQGISLSEKLQWKRGETFASLNLGEVYIRKLAYTEAFKHYNHALQLANQTNNKALINQIYLQTGFAHFKMSEHTKAVADFKKALAYFEEKNWKSAQFACYYIGSILGMNVATREEGRKYLNRVIEIGKNGNVQYVDAAIATLAGFGTSAVGYSRVIDGYLKSLETAKQAKETDEVARLTGEIGRVYTRTKDPRAVSYLLDAIKQFTKLKDLNRSAEFYQLLGSFYLQNLDYNNALDYYQKQLDLSKLLKNNAMATLVNLSIAYIFITTEDTKQALVYAQSAYQLSKGIADQTYALNSLNTLGDIYYADENYDQAIHYYEQALVIIKEKQSHTIKNNISTNLAGAYAVKKQYLKAYQLAKTTLSEVTNGSTYEENIFKMGNLRVLATVYMDAPPTVLKEIGVKPEESLQKAKDILLQILAFAKETQQLYNFRDIYKDLSIVNEKMNNYQEAYRYGKSHLAMRDSLIKTNTQNELQRRISRYEFTIKEDSLKYQQGLTDAKLAQQVLIAQQQNQALLLNQRELSLANAQKDNERLNFLKTQATLEAEQDKLRAKQQELLVSKKEKTLAQTMLNLRNIELNVKKTQSWYFIGGIVGLLLISFFVTRNFINQRKANKIISKEKNRSDELLLNILPADVAEELKENGTARARHFDEVTVLFTDFVNFTNMSELLSPQELVNELHYCFKAFDEIMTKYAIEKIKTIGDAYLAVCGLPMPIKDHAVNTVKAAKEISSFISDRRNQLGDKTFDIRIGIHSGSVVAGIVGVKKFAYDIWGDTVNTAARMEQNSAPGRINISESTYQLVEPHFQLTYRGEIAVKNKGALKMYFVEE